jgi:hypothetical protein
MFKEQSRYVELVDPLLQGDYPRKGLKQAVAVAAMCLQEEAMVRPAMGDVVVALSFLRQAPQDSTTSSPRSSISRTNEDGSAEDDAAERQRAVADAIEWGCSSRNSQMTRSQLILS